MLADNTVKGEIAYGVVAGVMWLSWLAVVVWSHIGSRGPVGETGGKALGKSDAGMYKNPERYGENGTA